MKIWNYNGNELLFEYLIVSCLNEIKIDKRSGELFNIRMAKEYLSDSQGKHLDLSDIANGCNSRIYQSRNEEYMTNQEKTTFLSEKVKELNKITSEIAEVFPEKSFKLDGILIGNIVEVLTAQAYGIILYRQSEKTHDGEVDGKRIQIKGTQGKESIVIREEPEYLLVEFLDKETGTIREIYNGPGALAWQYRSYVPSMNFYTIRINKLLELDAMIPDEERIKPIVPIKKYIKNSNEKKK